MTKPDEAIPHGAQPGAATEAAVEGVQAEHESTQPEQMSAEEFAALEAHLRSEALADAAEAHGQEEDRKAINSGVVENMQFQQALKMALGMKKIYFSASNPNITSPEGVNSVSSGGATYLRPDGDRHIVKAKVLSHDMQGELLANPHEEDLLCELPLAYSLTTSKKPIAEITEQEAKDAGYTRRGLQFRLAFQTEHAYEFTNMIAGYAAEMIKGKISGNPSPEQLGHFMSQIVPMVIEGMRFGKIMGDETLAQQAAAVIKDIVRSPIIKDSDIPGTTDIFSIGIATPKELVESGQAANEAEAKKVVGNALRALHNSIPGLTFADKAIRNEMAELYGPRAFQRMMESMSSQASELLGEVRGGRVLSLETQIRTSHREIGDDRRGELLKELEAAGPDAGKRDEIAGKFQQALAASAERKASAAGR